jgi:valyl-tRNA synthetase
MNKNENLKKPYDPKTTEANIHFEYSSDANSNKPPFCIIMPPPNITGTLHMGHALVTTIQDILIRFNRMNGKEALWVPGTDHAGIATQSVVEKKLFKETGKRRSDFKREEFVSHIDAWKTLHQEKITNQIKKLGASADWSKERFTLDEDATKSVQTVFKKMFEDGLIYRGDYLVNWDTHLQTAIADDEVEHEDKDGNLWFFKYPVADSDEMIVIATTRPETMLGDTAVAVNGSDERYSHLIGKDIKLPLSNRLIPIIKDHYVDKEFGTGCVKITPAHDFNDYEIGQRHDLPMINIMNEDGTVNENGGVFKGMTMLEARENVVERMRDLGLLDKVEFHKHRVGVSYRSKSVVEPLLSKQWFVKMESFKEKLLSRVLDGDIEIVPKEWEKTYKHWIDNLRDWCISRQLWWGHRIPIWYNVDDETDIICYTGDGVPPEVQKNPKKYRREEDVLDTWFSSALWPLTCLGWPEKTASLEKFYPTSVLVTGHDILFFWVARMILMGEYAGHGVPFEKVFLHGLIFAKSYWRKDEEGNVQYLEKEEWTRYERGEKAPKDVLTKWEKMSKSKGNIIDPLDIIDEYGTDALRLALTGSVTTSKQIDLDFRKFEESKNFANKLWNASSFVIQNIFEGEAGDFSDKLLRLEDKWILSKFSRAIESAHASIQSFNFATLSGELYHFFWDDFCAYYLEICKPYLYGKLGTEEEIANKKWILFTVLTGALKLFHPIAPFITEELFSILKDKAQNLSYPDHPIVKQLEVTFKQEECGYTALPTCSSKNEKIEQTFDEIRETLYSIRNMRQETNIPPGERVTIHIEEKKSPVEKDKEILFALTKIDQLHFHDKMPETAAPSSLYAMAKRKIMLIIPEALLVKEKLRLEKSLEKTLKNLENTKRQLSNKNFVERAPEALINEKKSLLDMLEQSKLEIEQKLATL